MNGISRRMRLCPIPCLLAAALLLPFVPVQARPHGLQQSSPQAGHAAQRAPGATAAQLAAKLRAGLQRIAEGLDGAIGLYAENLQTGQTFALHADETFPQASSIKIPILITLLRQDQEAKLHLSDRVTVRHSQTVGGSGVLQYFGDGTSSLALRDLATLMVNLSDNSATNIIIGRIGRDNVNAFLRSQGLTHTHLERVMIDQAAERANHENVSTPREMATLLMRLQRGRLLDATHTNLALTLLSDYKETPLRAGVPPAIRVADKPGSLTGAQCDSGIVFLENSPYVLSVMTAYDHDDHAADDAITAVSQAVFSYFDRLSRSNAFGVIVHPPAGH